MPTVLGICTCNTDINLSCLLVEASWPVRGNLKGEGGKLKSAVPGALFLILFTVEFRRVFAVVDLDPNQLEASRRFSFQDQDPFRPRFL